MSQKNSMRIEGIDGLRTVAVLSVIAFHFYKKIAPAGFIGVDVFFVISGYVISMSLTKNSNSSPFQYVLDFYKRRFIRIFPALICCLLVIGFFSVLFIPYGWLSDRNALTGTLAFLGLSNFALLQYVDGYFSLRADFNPFLHTWSLAVEEQFYVLFPLIFLFWIKKQPGKSYKNILAYSVPVLGVVSFIFAAYQTQHDQIQAFYMLPSRFWELAAGATLFQVHFYGYAIPRKKLMTHVFSKFGILLLSIGVIFAIPELFPFPWALAPVGGTVALLSVIRNPASSALLEIRILQHPAVTYLGRCSYSLYLWHWPVACLFRWTIGFEKISHIVLGLVLTFILGTASYHFVEKPFLINKKLRSLDAWKIVGGTAVLIGILTVGYYDFLLDSSPFRLSVVEQDQGWKADAFSGNAIKKLQEQKNHSKTLWVIGDSHAAAYESMVMQAALQNNMSVRMESDPGCSFVSVFSPNPDTPFCKDSIERFMEYLSKQASEGDVVFLASLRAQRLSDQWGELNQDTIDAFMRFNKLCREVILDQARTVIRRLLALKLKVIIDAPKPVFRAPAFRCSDWFNHMNPVCKPGLSISAAFLQQQNQFVIENLNMLHNEFPSLIIWDPFPILCPGRTCSVYQNGKPLFFDQDHLTGYGNLLLLPDFSNVLKQASNSS
ncbi:acyltransferase family protein [Desulfovibrio inopinatus]|uniref:acyltransferase family protein n=1 Tax=Desulfovibrio inopinatus TaxID=102109 RepID=UPI000424E4B6|nr:acyltransferase family protein [Desulfovibrio inopinatus]